MLIMGKMTENELMTENTNHEMRMLNIMLKNLNSYDNPITIMLIHAI